MNLRTFLSVFRHGFNVEVFHIHKGHVATMISFLVLIQELNKIKLFHIFYSLAENIEEERIWKSENLVVALAVSAPVE